MPKIKNKIYFTTCLNMIYIFFFVYTVAGCYQYQHQVHAGSKTGGSKVYGKQHVFAHN